MAHPARMREGEGVFEIVASHLYNQPIYTISPSIQSAGLDCAGARAAEDNVEAATVATLLDSPQSLRAYQPSSPDLNHRVTCASASINFSRLPI